MLIHSLPARQALSTLGVPPKLHHAPPDAHMPNRHKSIGQSVKMGRYTTVQSYSDNNANVRAISYDQARGTSSGVGGGGGTGAASGAAASAGASSGDAGSGGAGGAVRADKVYNPYGSTAGAGSGEFHIYRHARSREMARMKALDEAEETAKADHEFEQTVETWKDEEERKTAKRRKKRKREKEARERKKNLKLSGIDVGADNYDVHNNGGAAGVDDDEFEYTPQQQQQQQQPALDTDTSKSDEKPAGVEDSKESPPKVESVEASAAPFANDGSFLEMMRKKLADEEEAGAKALGDGDYSKEPGGDINTTKDAAE